MRQFLDIKAEEQFLSSLASEIVSRDQAERLLHLHYDLVIDSGLEEIHPEETEARGQRMREALMRIPFEIQLDAGFGSTSNWCYLILLLFQRKYNGLFMDRDRDISGEFADDDMAYDSNPHQTDDPDALISEINELEKILDVQFQNLDKHWQETGCYETGDRDHAKANIKLYAKLKQTWRQKWRLQNATEEETPEILGLLVPVTDELIGTDRDCSICREAFGSSSDEAPSESVVKLPCGHQFGSLCIRTWLKESHEFPLCRTYHSNLIERVRRRQAQIRAEPGRT